MTKTQTAETAAKPAGIPTRLIVMRPSQPSESITVNLPREPGYDRLRKLLRPLLNGAEPEHVSVLADFEGGTKFKRADMFVDEIGRLKDLPRNEAATLIYRRNTLLQHPGLDPEKIADIRGPAILFDRIVWM